MPAAYHSPSLERILLRLELRVPIQQYILAYVEHKQLTDKLKALKDKVDKSKDEAITCLQQLFDEDELTKSALIEIEDKVYNIKLGTNYNSQSIFEDEQRKAYNRELIVEEVETI